MPALHRRARRLLVAVASSLAALAGSAPGALANVELSWKDCEEGFECATARVPYDHRNWNGPKFELPVVRLRAQDESRRIGSLFVNPGGPGGGGVDFLRATARSTLAELNTRFDLVSWDPRGVAGSRPAIDCDVEHETEGPYGVPYPRPLEGRASEAPYISRVAAYVRRCLQRSGAIIPYVSTANTARDLDLLRRAVGDRRLSYLGFSYGTQIGATYASLFPGRSRALTLDGAVDPDELLNRPLEGLREQTQGFEQALDRFFIACAADQAACAGFGGTDPEIAYDELLERLDREPAPAPTANRPLPVNGDIVRNATLLTLYSKGYWPLLARGLAEASAGDASLLRELSDAFYGGEDGEGTDQYFMITALEARDEGSLDTYLRAGRHGYDLFPHFWINTGYPQLVDYFLRVKPRGVFRGPFENRASEAPALVVGTTYDPATPYAWSRNMTRDLGRARLLTMRGDGHTAYGESACIDAAVNAYLFELALPAEGTVCRQETGFAQPAAEPQAQRAEPGGLEVPDLDRHVAPVAAR